MIFADVKSFREQFYIEWFCQMRVDIMQDIQDFFVTQGGVQKFDPVFDGCTV